MDEKKYLIAVPCMDYISTPFVAALTSLKRIGAVKHSFLANSLVYEARNMLAEEAIETGADRILFIDSDMYFKPDLMAQLAADLDTGLDFVSGLFFKRLFPTQPLIYSGFGEGNKPQVYTHYPKDTMFPIAGCGFGAVMMNVKMLKDVADAYGSPFFPMQEMGEDIAFCWRAKHLGYKLWCDSRIKVGHAGLFIYGEDQYTA